MKKLLLVALLGISLHSSISAEAPTIQPRRKKSKEIALIRTLMGGFIAYKNANTLVLIITSAFNNSQTRNFCITNIPLPLLFFIIGSSEAQQGLNDLDEIAQYE